MRLFCWIVVGVPTLVLAGTVLVSGCGGGGGGGGSPPTLSATIGPAGGVIEDTDTSSPLYGVLLDVPPGALSADTTISIVSVDPASAPDGPQAVGVIVDLLPAGLQFSVPARLRLPFRDANQDGFLDDSGRPVHEAMCITFVEEAGEWESVPADSHGSDSVDVSIAHFSFYTTTSALRLRGPVVKIWYDPAADPTPYTHSSDHAQVKECILAAMGIGTAGTAVGPWNSFTTAPPPGAGWTIEPTDTMSESHIQIYWNDIPDSAPGIAVLARTRVRPRGQPDACGEQDVYATVEFNTKTDAGVGIAPFHMHPALDDVSPHNTPCGPSTVPVTKVDLFSTAAHELTHALGLDEDCFASEICNQLDVPPTLCSVVEGKVEGGESARVLTPPDESFFLQFHPFRFSGASPVGTVEQPEGMLELAITTRSIADTSPIDEGSAELILTPESLPQLPPLIPVGFLSGSGTERTFFFSIDGNSLPVGKQICAHLELEDLAAMPRSDYFNWTFDLFGSIVGTYVGEGTATNTGCTDSEINRTFAVDVKVEILSQTATSFSGRTTSTIVFEGNEFEGFDVLHGTIGPNQTISGTMEGEFGDTTSEGTFSGQVVGDTIHYSFTSMDTSGETCTTTGDLTAHKE